MTKREKVKKFVKEHKKDIIIYSTFGVFAGIGTACTIKGIQNAIKINKMQKNTKIIDIPNLTVNDFGRVGEEMIFEIDEITKDTPVKYWKITMQKNN